VESAIAAALFGEQRSLRGHPHDIRITRVDQNLTEMLGVLEADLLPRRARIGALVEPAAEMRAALAVVLASTEPHDVRVLRIDDDAAQRKGRIVLIEDRL